MGVVGDNEFGNAKELGLLNRITVGGNELDWYVN